MPSAARISEDMGHPPTPSGVMRDFGGPILAAAACSFFFANQFDVLMNQRNRSASVPSAANQSSLD